MTEKEYLLKWIIDPSGAVAGAQQITSSLLALEQVIDRVGPKLKSVASGAGPSLSAASRRTTALAGNMQNLQAQATGAASALQQTGSAAAALRGGMGRATGGANGLSSALLGIGPAALTMGVVREAVQVLSEALKDAREYARQTAEENLKLRDSLRELAALKGKAGPTDAESHEVMDLMLSSGANRRQASDYDTLWESTLPAAREMKDAQGNKTWKLDKAQEQELKAKTLQFAIQ